MMRKQMQRQKPAILKAEKVVFANAPMPEVSD